MTPYPTPDALWMIILSMEHSINHVYTNEKFDSMYGWYDSNVQNMWKIAFFVVVIFDDFWDLWWPDMTPYPTPDALCMIMLSTQSIMY